MKKNYLTIIITAICISGCINSDCYKQVRDKSKIPPLSKADPQDIPYFTDDLPKKSILEALALDETFLSRLPAEKKIHYGNETYSVSDLRESLALFKEILLNSKNWGEFNNRIKRDFDIFISDSYDENGVLNTGYFEPVLKGSSHRTEIYKYPIYKTPADIVIIKLGDFRENLEGKSIAVRVDNNSIIPYYNRAEIDSTDTLKEKGLEIAWLSDPIDRFLLHIQGSGIIEMEDGTAAINVNYDSSNGRDYKSIGNLLIKEGKINIEDMSIKAIKDYLLAHPEEMVRVMNYNESYVFFRTVEDGPIGSTGVKMTSGRSIASDPIYYPKGGLAYIETESPVTDKDGNILEWKKITRFVIDQDAGGAIKGHGRIDLFFGTGETAGMEAGMMKRYGKLFYLMKKK